MGNQTHLQKMRFFRTPEPKNLTDWEKAQQWLHSMVCISLVNILFCVKTIFIGGAQHELK